MRYSHFETKSTYGIGVWFTWSRMVITLRFVLGTHRITVEIVR